MKGFDPRQPSARSKAAVALSIAAFLSAFLIACSANLSQGGEIGDPPAATPLASNADLASLSVSPGSLDPPFSADVTSYSVIVPNPVASVVVSGTAVHPTASVSAPITLGGLVAGVPKMASLTVTPATGEPKRYLVLVTRAPDYPAGDPIYVNRENPDEGDGTIDDPFRSIQTALNAVDPDSENAEIRVAQGRYPETIVLRRNQSISILGGFKNADFSVRDPGSYVTAIQGNGATEVLSMLFSGDASDPRIRVVIDGCTISGGSRGLVFDSQGNGGKMDLVISDNVIEGNGTMIAGEDLLPLWGGGVYVNGDELVPSVIGNIIRNNASGKGAGLCVLRYDGPDDVYIAGNLIQGNVGHSDHGGGVYLSFLRGTFADNVVRGNRIGATESAGWGGGIIVDGGTRTGFGDTVFVQLSGNVYSGNHAPSIGGGIFIDEGANVRMTRELVYGNTIAADPYFGGAGIYVDGPRTTAAAKTVLTYCTVADNTGPDGSTGNGIFAEVGAGLEIDALVEIDHCIFWGNHSPTQFDASDFFLQRDESNGRYASLAISYSAYERGCSGGGTFRAGNCFRADPLFVDADSGNYASTTYPTIGAFGTLAP